jgi:hypothetical protein
MSSLRTLTHMHTFVHTYIIHTFSLCPSLSPLSLSLLLSPHISEVDRNGQPIMLRLGAALQHTESQEGGHGLLARLECPDLQQKVYLLYTV